MEEQGGKSYIENRKSFIKKGIAMLTVPVVVTASLLVFAAYETYLLRVLPRRARAKAKQAK